MKSTRDQDITTGIISLGLLANKLSWYLIGGSDDLPSLKVDTNLFKQWKAVLKDTIDFIHTPEAGQIVGQTNGPRFLSQAQYLEQIYTAAPIEKKDIKKLSAYLENTFDSLDKLERKEKLSSAEESNLLSFSSSIADESIKEAARFHQESHERRESVIGRTVKASA